MCVKPAQAVDDGLLPVSRLWDPGGLSAAEHGMALWR